jgi:hypothetical protein
VGLSKDLKEAVGVLTSIQEASLSRIWQHHKNGSFVIITSWRGVEHKPKKMSNQEWLALNRQVFAKLKKQVMSDGYGFIPAEGVGQEKTNDGVQYEATEPVIIVPNPKGVDSDKSLLKKALKWGRAPGGKGDFKQDYVFYHTVDESGQAKSAIINPMASADNVKFKNFKPGDISDYYTRIKGKRTFAYEWVGLKYGDPPVNLMGAHGSRLNGEVEPHLRETMEGWADTFADLL